MSFFLEDAEEGTHSRIAGGIVAHGVAHVGGGRVPAPVEDFEDLPFAAAERALRNFWHVLKK